MCAPSCAIRRPRSTARLNGTTRRSASPGVGPTGQPLVGRSTHRAPTTISDSRGGTVPPPWHRLAHLSLSLSLSLALALALALYAGGPVGACTPRTGFHPESRDGRQQMRGHSFVQRGPSSVVLYGRTNTHAHSQTRSRRAWLARHAASQLGGTGSQNCRVVSVTDSQSKDGV